MALVALLAGCGDDPEVPVPPDMSPLIEAYDSPTADFGPGTLDALAARIEATVRAVDELLAVRERLAQLIDDALGAAAESQVMAMDEGPAPGVGIRRQALSIAGSGYLRIRHICHGFGDNAPVDAEANGTAELYVTATEAGLDPIIWGTARQCKYTLGGRDLVIDGDIRLYIGDLGQLDSVRQSPVLFDLDLRVVAGDQVLIDSGLDFRVCPATAATCQAGRIELSMSQDGGNIVFFVDAGRATGGVRARNGTFECSFADRECRDEQGEIVSIPELVLGGEQ